MNIYDVQLNWPRSSKQPVYAEEVPAATQAEAKLIAVGRAKQQGWKGAPIGQKAVILRGEV